VAKNQGLSLGAKIALSIVALGAMCVPCTGVTLALGLPAGVSYFRRARVAEARGNVEMIRIGLDASGALPPSLAPTPPLATVGAERRLWPGDADPGWARIGFVPMETLYYSYSVTSDPMLGTVHIEAVGDLDGDGIRSSLSRTGHFVGTGYSWDELIVLDELE
jgi:hypothetical protein